MTNDSQIVMVRNRILPLIKLYEIFDITPKYTEASDAIIVITQSLEKEYCIQIDELIGKQQVVIKSLGKIFENIKSVSGSAIMSDGTVGLILDTDYLGDLS